MQLIQRFNTLTSNLNYSNEKIIYPFLMLSVLFTACKKDDDCDFTETTKVATAAEKQYIEDFLADTNLVAVAHPSGIYYNILQNGNGTKPNVCSYISVKYKGTYFDGTVFDQTEDDDVASFYLGELIGGWHKGVPLIGEGGKIRLYIPPTLGYGPDGVVYQGVQMIPPNAYLIFDIELLDIQ